MKTLVAVSILALASGSVAADWEDVWQNPDLSNNFAGHTVTNQSPVYDPLELTYRGNVDMYAGGEADAFAAIGPTSYDVFVRGNPDIDVCGCI